METDLRRAKAALREISPQLYRTNVVIHPVPNRLCVEMESAEKSRRGIPRSQFALPIGGVPPNEISNATSTLSTEPECDQHLETATRPARAGGSVVGV